jgi:hypothetical protein
MQNTAGICIQVAPRGATESVKSRMGPTDTTANALSKQAQHTSFDKPPAFLKGVGLSVGD